jgi:hypothetical protein
MSAQGITVAVANLTARQSSLRMAFRFTSGVVSTCEYGSFHGRVLRKFQVLLIALSEVLRACTSMVDSFPYKEEVGGSSPSVPTRFENSKFSSES